MVDSSLGLSVIYSARLQKFHPKDKSRISKILISWKWSNSNALVLDQSVSWHFCLYCYPWSEAPKLYTLALKFLRGNCQGTSSLIVNTDFMEIHEEAGS